MVEAEHTTAPSENQSQRAGSFVIPVALLAKDLAQILPMVASFFPPFFSLGALNRINCKSIALSVLIGGL